MVTVWTNPISSGSIIAASDINELRNAINNNRRASYGAGDYPWAEAVVSGTLIKGQHYTEMRDRIQELWTFREMGSLPDWSSAAEPEGGVTAGARIYATDLTDLRTWLNRYEMWFLGMCLDIYNPIITNAVAEDLANLSVGWFRLEFKPAPGSGTVNQQDYHSAIAKIREYNPYAQFLGLLDSQSISSPYPQCGSPSYNDTFVQQTGGLISNFPEIAWWEVWNEEDGGGSPMSPANCADLIIKMYEMIKTKPGPPGVLFGGLSNVWEPDGPAPWDCDITLHSGEYLRQVYEDTQMQSWYTTNGRHPWDAIGVHPYADYGYYQGRYDPDQYLCGNQTSCDYLYTYIRTVMNSHGDSGVPIWVTEIGWNSADDSDTANIHSPLCNLNPNTYPNQATLLRKGFINLAKSVDPAYLSRNGKYVHRVFWFQYIDFAVPNPDPPPAPPIVDNWFGVVDGNLNHKAYTWDEYRSLLT